MTPTATSALWFVAIVVMIPLALWLLKRSPYGAALGARAGLAAPVRAVASMPLGPQQRIVTVEVGQGEARRWLVLGVTPHHVGTLHVLDAPPLDAQEAAANAAPPFASLLKALQRGGRDAS